MSGGLSGLVYLFRASLCTGLANWARNSRTGMLNPLVIVGGKVNGLKIMGDCLKCAGRGVREKPTGLVLNLLHGLVAVG